MEKNKLPAGIHFVVWMIGSFFVVSIVSLAAEVINHQINKVDNGSPKIPIACVETTTIGCNWAGQEYKKSFSD